MEWTTETALAVLQSAPKSILSEDVYQQLQSAAAFVISHHVLPNHAIYAQISSLLCVDIHHRVQDDASGLQTYDSFNYLSNLLRILTFYETTVSSLAKALASQVTSETTLAEKWNDLCVSNLLLECISNLSMHLSSLLQQRISALPSTNLSTIDALLCSSLRFFPSLIQRSIRETLVDMLPHQPVDRVSLDSWLRTLGIGNSFLSVIATICDAFEVKRFLDQLVSLIASDSPASADTKIPSNLRCGPFDLTSYTNQLNALYFTNQQPTDVILLFFVKSLRFFHDHRLPKDLAEACLQPIRDTLQSRSDIISCLFLVMSRDMPELLTTVPAKKSDDGMWDLAQLAQNGAIDAPFDYLSEFVKIFPDVSTFVRKTEEFFASQLLVATEESDETLALERLLFFVIKRLGRRAATRLLVMLRDVRTSRQLNQSLRRQIEQNRFFGCTVVSRACWPPMAEMRLKLPAAAAAAQRRVERFFKKAFPRRVLQTVPNLGRVELEVTVAGETRAFRCSPVQFAVLQSVCENRAMTVEEVSFALVCPRAEAEAGVTFWVEQGVVLCASETPRQFRRVKFFGEKGLEMGGERDDGGVLEAMRPFERFVVDILNVCYDFDVAKLQRRLTVFLQGANRYDRSEEDLRVLLRDMERRNVVYEEKGVLKLRQYFG
ncbi:hypothetical protein WA588_006216 [Blastocystis sp. NMH]